MKRLLFVLLSGGIAVSANAQYMSNSVVKTHTKASRTIMPNAIGGKHLAAKHRTAAKTTAGAPFFTEDFSSGTPTILPSGWTAGSMPAGSGTWHWANVASTSTFSMGLFNSTTAANGWMIFDSDSIGAATGGSPSGYLQSPVINCSAHPYVRLNFENFYRKFNDSCSIWVSTNPAFTPGSYAVYPVVDNNVLGTNAYTANPSTVHVNISPLAGSQPSVYVRFVYYGYVGGSYAWMVDDVSVTDVDPIDVGVSKTAAVTYAGSDAGFAGVGTKPSKIADTVMPVTFLANYGYTAEPATSVNGKIYQGTTSVYDQTLSVNLPVNAYDTLADFSTNAIYYSTTKATYTIAAEATMASDADVTNNTDSTRYVVSDSTWNQSIPGGSLYSSYFVHNTTGASYTPGTEFKVKAGQIDTVTSVSIAFDDATIAGQVVGAQIYHFDGTGWFYDGTTTFRALTADDISTSEVVHYANFAMDYTANGGYMILNGGENGVSYAAVVKGQSNTALVSVLAGDNAGPFSIVSYVGLTDTSLNDGAAGQQFGQDGLPGGASLTPAIALNLGNPPALAVNNVNANGSKIGRAYPNPANNTVSVPFTISNSATVTVTLSNVVGQVVSTQTINAAAGQQAKATFATTDLTAGVYIYSVQVNGTTTTGKITIAH